jgi:formylglycine-generating enzyme required for sulfatase activity
VQDIVAAPGAEAQADIKADANTDARADAKTRVFISYSRKDMAFADRLETALKARSFEVLIDRDEIYAFEDWWKRLQALIGSSDTVIFVLSPDAVASREVQREIAYAASLNKRFAPIVCRRVDDATVPEALRRLNFIFFDDAARFDDSADKLADALQTDIVWIRDHTKFGEAARGWAAAGRPSGLLLRTPALEMAEYWIASRPRGAPEPTADIRGFISASRQGARSAQRLRRFALGSIFSLMLAVILGLIGWINQDYLIAQWRWWTVIRPYAAAQMWPHLLSAAQEQALKPGDAFRECASDCPQMIVVPAGSFMMGLPPTPKLGAESPQHKVTIAKAFAVSKYELTFADWDACVAGGGCNGYRPDDEGWGRGQQPALNVDWSDAQQYVAWLSLVTGKTYRLLSEAEYEYAARAGTTTQYPWGDAIKLNGAPMASCDGCGSKWDDVHPAPVGSFPPNKFGLYDMVGNVWEWTQDCAHPSYNGAPADGSAWLQGNGGDCNERHLRAGSYLNAAIILGSAIRYWNTSGERNFTTGFRVARTLGVP